MHNHNIKADIKNTTHSDKIPFSSLLICFFLSCFLPSHCIDENIIFGGYEKSMRIVRRNNNVYILYMKMTKQEMFSLCINILEIRAFHSIASSNMEKKINKKYLLRYHIYARVLNTM